MFFSPFFFHFVFGGWPRLDVGKQINRIAAQKKLLANLWNILRSATGNGQIVVPVQDLLDMSDLCAAVGGAAAAHDLVTTRQGAQQAVADVVFKQLDEDKTVVTEVPVLARVLRLPGVHEVDPKLASMWPGRVDFQVIFKYFQHVLHLFGSFLEILELFCIDFRTF